MSNYANLLEEASAIICRAKVYDPRRMVNANLYILAANVMEELVEALVTVSNQNRNLRADLELTKRDYEANLEELLRVSETHEQVSAQNDTLRALAQILSEYKNIKVNLFVMPDDGIEEDSGNE